MSTSATPATRNEGGGNQVPCLPRKVTRRHRRLIPPQARHQNQPTVPQVPCLPRKTKVDVAKCHACHVKRRWLSPRAKAATQSAAASPATNRAPSAPPEPAQCSVPRLPRKTKVDVAKCHACHTKGRWMSPSATPATQSAAASPATNPAPSAPPEPAQCPQCHTCHAKRRWMSPSAMPAT